MKKQKYKKADNTALITPINTSNIVLKYGWALVSLIALIAYYPALSLGLTNLDDTIFISGRPEQLGNLNHIGNLFYKGCFYDKDIYYRPILMIYFKLMNVGFTSDVEKMYHLSCIAMHMINCILILSLLNKLTHKKVQNFCLSCVFAAHPVLTMAVAWIPGSNDLLLTIFTLIYFISMLQFVDTRNKIWLLTTIIFYLLALFTKETAAFIPLATIGVLWFKNAFKKANYFTLSIVGISTIIGWIFWLIMRSNILDDNSPLLINADLISVFAGRLVCLIQYFGKVIFPIQLSVQPFAIDESIWIGILAICVLTILILLNKNRNNKIIFFGMAWFMVFLLPMFFVPKAAKLWLFEHRLYLPMLGALLMLGETILFSNKLFKHSTYAITIIIVMLGIFKIYEYTPAFSNPILFTKNAAMNSPHSSRAQLSYGERLAEDNNINEALKYFNLSLKIDSNQGYTRYYIAKYKFLPAQQWDSMLLLLHQEIKLTPKFPNNYLELARANLSKNNRIDAETNLEHYHILLPQDDRINDNLMELYIQNKNFKKAKIFADNEMKDGASINPKYYQIVVESLGLTNK
jgi:hypothetical protein